MRRQFQQSILISKRPHCGQPFRRNAQAQELVIRNRREQGTPGYALRRMARNDLHHFPNFHDLGSTGLRMYFQFAFFSPRVGLVVMIHIAEQQTLWCAVYDNADIHAHRQGPEIFVPAAIQLMKTKP